MNSLLEVVTEAEATALTTLERVKLELKISNDDNDEILQAKIDEASSDIILRVRHSLKRERLSETFRHSAGDGPIENLVLRKRPVVSVVSVTLDDELVDDDEYWLDPAPGLLFRLTEGGYPRHWYFAKTAVVVYDAGYLLPGQTGRDLPASLEAAAIELVSSFWSSRGRDVAVRSETVFGVGSTDYWVGAIGASGDLPPGVMSKIAPFRAGGYS